MHRAAAGHAFVHLFGRRGLRGEQLLLHLLRLLEQCAEVEALGRVGHRSCFPLGPGSTTSLPGNAALR